MELFDNISVSSVLNRDVKAFGKKHIFDGSEETCWHSAEGNCQWVKISFKELVKIKGFEIQFQGGFAGNQCVFKCECEDISEPFYPVDTNAKQSFHLSKTLTGKLFSFLFESSTDFFGRIVIYSIRIYFDE